MAIFNDFPYSNLHNENLQWIIETLKQSGASIGEISTALEKVQEEIANLDIPANISQITSNFKNDYFVICGDSYCVERADYKTWPMLLRDQLGLPEIQYQNISIGGYGFIGQNGTHQGQLSSASITADKNKITKIFVGCGYNDRTYKADAIYSAMASFDSYVKVNFPNAEIILIYAAMDNVAATRSQLATVYQAYSRCAELGWKMIDAHCLIAGLYYMRDDGHHPNAQGSQELFKKISAEIRGGQYVKLTSGTVTPGDTITSDAFTYLQENYGSHCINKIVQCSNIVLVTELTEGQNVSIGTCPQYMYGFSYTQPFSTPGAFLSARSADNKIAQTYFGVYANNGTFNIGVRLSSGGLTNVKTLFPVNIEFSDNYMTL